MSSIFRKPLPVNILLALIVLAFTLAGCSDDTTQPVTTPPDATVAAGLSSPAKTAGQVSATLGELDMFENPMTSMAGDAGIYEDMPSEIWTGEPVSYPQKSAQAAAAFRSVRSLAMQAGDLALASSQHIRMVLPQFTDALVAKEAGDTLAVEYFDGPDSTGLNALIETDTVDMVRFVMQRQYPPLWLHVVRRDLEMLIDTGGTLEDPADDQYHSATMEEEMFGGQASIGMLAPVSGSGPMGPDVQVEATFTVHDPRFNPLQEWTEAVVVLEPGDFEADGDETIYSFQGTVHWRSDAEHNARIEPVGGGAIQPDVEVLAVGSFTAAPANNWLESVADTLRVQLGDLDDEEDDILFAASRSSVFDGVASDGGNPRSYVILTPEEPVSPGDEPCGGEAYQDIWYPGQWWLVHLQRDAEIGCDGSGSLHELMEFRNGSSYERTITWDGAGGATVTESRADGTAVSGTYNESTGDFSLTTTFPDGHDPVSRHRHGRALDGSVDAYDITVWQDAHPDSSHFTATETEGGYSINGYRVDGTVREEYTLSSQGDESLQGNWSRNDGAIGSFTLEQVEGGGAHLLFSASDPSAEGDPSVAGEIFYAPDGSGTGTITYTENGVTVTFDIVIHPDGTAHIVDGEGNEIPL